MTIDKTFEQTTGEINPTPAEEIFQWTKQWYPVAIVEFLDPFRPHSMQLLGKDIVLWRDKQGKWSCFEDACPHRLVPLSEGRIESDGTLLCAYHAWRFNSEGKCVSIPQSFDKETEKKHCASSRSCATVYPTQVRQGLLWVWGESGTDALKESKLREPSLVPELEDSSGRVLIPFKNFKDASYGWDFFIENACDPAHVPVSHHGISGSRYKDAKYYDLKTARKISTTDGFAFEMVPVFNGAEQILIDFQPPSLVQITSNFEKEGKSIFVLYASPTRPGWCRFFAYQILVKNLEGKMPAGFAFFAFPLPFWISHLLATLFIHQDLVLLHYQEKNLAKKGIDKLLNLFYTPNPQDKMVNTFRQWFDKRAGGEIPWDENYERQLPSPERDKQKLFDVWNTHTKNCHVCQKALSNINRISVTSYLIAIICLCWGIIIDARYTAIKATQLYFAPEMFSSYLTWVPPLSFWLAAIGAVLFALTGYFLKKLTRLFYVYTFEHFHND